MLAKLIPIPILIAVVWSPGTPQEFTNPHVSKQISTNLQVLFEQTMQGCTIRSVFDGRRSYSEDIFVMLARRESSVKTFIADEYRVFKNSMLIPSWKGQGVLFDQYSPHPQWQLKRYTMCYTHLYIAEDDNDFQTIIRYHFVDFDLRKENPDFVIIWDLNQSESRYIELFSLQEFYRSFMDYRLIIRRDFYSSMFDVGLVCIICPWRFPERIVSPLITPPTLSNIHGMWQDIHINHFGMEVSCTQCFMRYAYSEFKYTKFSFEWWIAKLTNATLSLQYDSVYTTIGQISLNTYLTPEEVPSIFTSVRHPQATMSSSFLNVYDYKMFTVVRKNLFVAPGLREFAAPLTKLSWWSTALSILFIVIISRTAAMNMSSSSLLLSILGPLTDQWAQNFNPTLRPIFIFWGILCYSITMLYGGELASCLAVLQPPKYPKSLADLLDISTTVTSLNDIGTGTTFTFRSKLADSLENQELMWRDANIHDKRLGRLARVINEVNFGYCENEMRVFNRSDEETPFLCINKSYVTQPDKPITFVDNRYRHILERYVFQDSPLYWVSSTSRVPEAQDQFPLIVSRNYLAKLVLPMGTLWAASGLNQVWEQTEDNIYAAIVYSEKRSTFNSDMDGESTRVIDFTPLALRTHIAVIALCSILVGVALTVFLLEWLSGTCVVTFVPLKKHKKLYTTDEGLQQNQETGSAEVLTARAAELMHFKMDDAIKHKDLSLEATYHNGLLKVKIFPDHQQERNEIVSVKQIDVPQSDLSTNTKEKILKPQHGLLLRDLAQSFNRLLNSDLFHEPMDDRISNSKQSPGASKESGNRLSRNVYRTGKFEQTNE